MSKIDISSNSTWLDSLCVFRRQNMTIIKKTDEQ